MNFIRRRVNIILLIDLLHQRFVYNMASTLHVKEKTAWKKVSIPQDLLNTEEFDGLIDIQELTDYELVQVNTNSDDEDGKKKKIKKRKIKLETTLDDELETTQLQTLPKKKNLNKKRKLQQSKTSDDSQDLPSSNSKKSRGESEISEISCEIGTKGKLKKINDKAVDVNNINKAGDLTIANIQTSIKKQKLKKRKKKKQKNQKKIDLRNEPDNKCEENTNNEKPLEVITDMSQWKHLFVPEVLLKAMQDQGFEKPTEIQKIALPSAIRDRKDILGAAETGSGKTLAFGIPVLSRILSEALIKLEDSKGASTSQSDEDGSENDDEDENKNNKKLPISKHNSLPPLALILEPTRELAIQVKNHLSSLAKYTDIKFATVLGGMSVEKQRRILEKHPHVIIATPGRLWQLIEEGNDHLSQVDKILCLVVDEADRMVERGHYEELTKILEMLNNSPRRSKNRQTFVMSATLTIDVAAPKRLMNKRKPPKKDEDKLKSLTERICVGLKPKVIDLTPKDKVAQTLTELRVNCNADEKDFYLYYFLCQHPGRTIVFVNSKDCLRRLASLFGLLKCSPLPLHADMQQRQRLKNLDKFAGSSQGLLIASDVAARGLDIPKVDHVIHYQVPRTMENYIHRSGRTARASNLGLSVIFVGPEEAKDYRKIVHGVRNGEELPLMPVEMDLFPAVKQRVRVARVIDVTEHRLKKKHINNNFFLKAAEEMDMIVDDERLLEDLGDSVQQAQDKQQLKDMKSQLESMLHKSLAPLRMSKYPTKSGQLVLKKSVNLYERK
ncbi:ATP-dependent RNA helicase ddx24 [Bulinus truncatus]|nr:ATP-dependent RNA helicase ddx24 [Bulinus truncatus]